MSDPGVPTAVVPPVRASHLRVLHVLTEPRGGGGVHVRQLARSGGDGGEDVTLAVPALRSGSAGRVGPTRLARAVRRADVVHCHGIRAVLATPPSGRAHLVVTTHGLHGLRGPRGARGSAFRALTLAALSRAERIICVSEDDALEVAALSPRLARRSVTIPNGVAPLALASLQERSAARADLGVEPSQPVALLVGSLIHQKHPELALEAIALARPGVPGLVLLVAGDGPLMPDLRRIAGPGVRLLGHRDDVQALLAASDVVLNTSRWEGLSLALLEALWRGRPLVTTDSPGNPEAVGDAGIVAPENAEALAGAMVRMFAEPGLLAMLGERARSRAEVHFDAHRMVDATLAVHAEVAS